MPDRDASSKRHHQREAFALALAQGVSQQEAAARAGIHRNTARAWERDAEVKHTIAGRRATGRGDPRPARPAGAGLTAGV